MQSTEAIIPTATPYENFLTVLRQQRKAPDTITTYDFYLKYYAKQTGQSVNELVNGTQKQIQDRIKAFYVNATPPQATKVSAALSLFFAVNEITIDWKIVKLLKPVPPEVSENETRPYHKPEIETLLRAANERTRLSILTMATAGLRVGALPGIRVQDLIWIDKYSLYAITVYPKTRAEYLTFLTPQTSGLMARFVKKAKGDHVFFNYHDTTTAAGKGAHVMAVWRLLVKTGLRKPTDRQDRKETMLNHSLRQHYRTVLENAGIKEEHAEKLMDHGPKLVRTYAKPTPEQWLETSQYMKAVPQLTFSF